jgi:hypothetical protein
MHPSKLSTPPPGMLGADSLGLTVEPVVSDEVPPPPPLPGKVAVTPAPGAVVVSPPGVVAVVVVPPGPVTVVPPPPRKVEVVGGLSGATGGTCGAGVPMADGGIALGVVVVLPRGEASDPPEVNDPVEPALAAAAEPPRPAPWAAACWGDAPATRRPAAAAAASPAMRRSGMGDLRFCGSAL